MKAFDGFLVLVFLCFLWFDEPETQNVSIQNSFPEPIGGLVDLSEVEFPLVTLTEYDADSVLFHWDDSKLVLPINKEGKIKAFKSLSGRTHIVELPIGYDNINETYETWSHYCGSCKEPLTRM